MGKIWLPTGGSGGLDPDELTADASDVLKGKIAGINGNDEPAAGTLELTGTADDSDVLSGRTYYNTDAKQKRTGSIPVNGSMNTSLNCGQSKTIPAGYTTGGTVTANSLASQTSATASAGHIFSGQTAWVNGNKITGNMPERGGYGGTGNSQGNDGGNQRFYMNLPNGHYNENARAYIPWSNVRSWAGLTPDKIKKNVSIMGITGSWEGYATSPLYLFNNGSWNGLSTTGITNRSSDDRSAVRNGYIEKVGRKGIGFQYGLSRFNATVDLTNYNYLKANVSYCTSKAYPEIGVLQSASGRFTASTSGATGQCGIIILNISSLTGMYYIGFEGSYSNNEIYRINQVFLSRT